MAFDNVPVVAAAVILVVLQSLSIDAIVWQSACMFHQLRIVKQQVLEPRVSPRIVLPIICPRS